jgi:hypothetical protein
VNVPLSALAEGSRFRLASGVTGVVIRQSPSSVTVQLDRGARTVNITDPQTGATLRSFRARAKPTHLAPGAEVEPL